ncbi:ubiquitin-specific protease doa4 [Coemansia brasiliensis]|uniref:ubiquitinyl hydrolase 1 n=1 Tax=Coemansia brasiliensis TaxID=2650707 RepID=A0A9W8IBG0_9FUNG|nr:ubiquitin-specific protease doa4 [Coemansia brasiliensis]
MSSRNSHTSDLIKRFENMSSPKAPAKPATLSRRSTSSKSWSKPKQSTGDDQSSLAAIATIEAAQSALSSAIAHAHSPAPSRWHRRPSLADTPHTHPTSMPAPAPMGMSIDKPSNIFPQNRRMMPSRSSTFSHSLEHQESPIIKSLNRLAELDSELQMPSSLWLEYAETCIDDAQQSYNAEDYQTAYVKYVTACNTFIHKLRPMQASNNPKYNKLRADINTWIADEIKSIRAKIEGKETAQSNRAAGFQPRQNLRQTSSNYNSATSPVRTTNHEINSRLSGVVIMNQNKVNNRKAVVVCPESDDEEEVPNDGVFEQEIEESNPTQTNSSSSSATDLSSMLSYHASADKKPGASNYNSRSNSRQSRDSDFESDPVADFVQRNSNICPPRSQRDSYRSSARSSTTPHDQQSTRSRPQSTKPSFSSGEIGYPQPVATATNSSKYRPPPLPLQVLPPRPQLPAQAHHNVPRSTFDNSVSRYIPPPPQASLPPAPRPVYAQARSTYSAEHPAYGESEEPPFSPNGTRLYNHYNAAGSDPALNGQLHSGSNPRNSAVYDHPAISSPPNGSAAGEVSISRSHRASQISDSGVFGVTGLKNFGNTCFMNSVIQCLIGTKPLTRYFMCGDWKKDFIQEKPTYATVTREYAQVVENMWRGQYGFVSPKDFRKAIADCSEQFKGNDQEDAHEFASFLLDTLHETLNRRHPRPPPERDMTVEEELQFESLDDKQQSDLQWNKFIRRNDSVVTNIFQGQIQSRLMCMVCHHTSTTYHTFTELSLPIPVPGNDTNTSDFGDANGPPMPNHQPSSSLPVNIYQCLEAYAETEILDGENKWMCPQCKAKRPATKQLMISRLPLVLIVHLKRFSTIGHFREKLSTNVLIPTVNLTLQNYVTTMVIIQPVYLMV